MGKFTAIQTYDRFLKLWEQHKVNDHSLNFIIDTGQLYTHGIFLNSVAYETEADGAVQLTIAGTSKNLSLSNHTHLTYLEKNANINLGAYKIVSGEKDLLYYSGGNTYLGDITTPTIILGTSLSTVRNNNTYTVLDTGNFSIGNTTAAGYILLNVAVFKYGSSSFQLDYVKRVNTSSTFDALAVYTSAGTTQVNNKLYGFITLYTDGTIQNPSWSQFRVDITDLLVQFRTSKDSTKWLNLLTKETLPINALNVDGIVTAPTSSTSNKVWKTDSSGNPAWRSLSPSISAGTTDTKNIKISVGGEDSNEFTVPYATNAEYLNNYSVSDPSSAKQDLKVRWFAQISSTTGGGSGYAGQNYGFPVSNNANGILWLGTHSGNYGGQVGISSDNNLYYRYIRGGSFLTTADGGSWKRIVFATDLSNYLPLAGGTMTGAIKRTYSSASTDPALLIDSADLDIIIWKVYSSELTYTADASMYGYSLKYLGTGSGNDNKLVLYSDNQTGTKVAAITVTLDGRITIGNETTVNGDSTLGSKSIYYQRSTRGAIHHEFIGDDADYGVAKIRHLNTEGSGGPGGFTASLAIFDERLDRISGAYQPTFYINRSGATRVPDLMGIDVGGTRVFTVTSAGTTGTNGIHHLSHDNDDSVLLAGGGYKALSNLSVTGTTTSLTSLDTSKTFIYASLSSSVTASNFTLSTAMSVGQCLTVLVYNSSNATISIEIPSSWQSLDGATLNCGASKFLEISIVCYASGSYILSSKAQ